MDIKKLFLQFAPVSDACIESIEKMSLPFTASRGEIMVHQGEPCNYIYFFTEGVMRIGLRKGGKEDTLCFGGKGDIFFSCHTLYANEPSPYMLTVLEEASGLMLPLHRYKLLEQKYPELISWMRNFLIQQLYSFEGLYANFALADPMERYINFWRTPSEALKHIPTKSLTKIVPLKYIAQYLGITQQTLSRVRRLIVGK